MPSIKLLHLLPLCAFYLVLWPALLAAYPSDIDQPEGELRSFTPPPAYETTPELGVFAHTEPGVNHIWGPKAHYKATICVTRYYGSQQERSRQIATGLMPRNATLVILAGDCDDKASGLPYAPEIDRIFFNGKDLGILHGENDIWLANYFEIPCEEINFPSSPGDVGENTLEIIIDSANTEKRWYLELYTMALQIRAPQPIFLVHGWTINTAALVPMRELIRKSWGIPCEMGVAPMDNAPKDNGALLANQLAGYASKYKAGLFNIIAHSKGGLDSRVLIDEHGAGSNDVKDLHQIATPNAGSHLANILAHPKNFKENSLSRAARAAERSYRKITPGMLSLTPENCAIFNQKYISPNAGTSTITGRIGNIEAGDDGFSYSMMGKFSYNHDFNSQDWNRQGDGIVSVSSAHALRTQVKASPLTSQDNRYAHNQIILKGAGDVLNCFAPTLLERPASLKPKNPDETRATVATSGARVVRHETVPAAALAALEAAMAEVPETEGDLRGITPSFEPDHNYIKDLLLDSGQTDMARFALLAPTEHAAFFCARTNSDMRITLVRPDGTTQEFPEPPNASVDEVASLFGVRMLELSVLPSGVYGVRVENSGGFPVFVTAACLFTGSAPEVKLKVEDSPVPRVIAWLEQDGAVVESDHLPIQCNWISAANSLDDARPITLTYAGDGCYVGELPELAEGEYEFHAQWLDQFGEPATGSTVNYCNYLVSGELLPLTDSGSKVPGKFSDYCTSGNPSLCRGIQVGVDATVSRAGNYMVTATLRGKDGTELSQGACHQTAETAGAIHFDLLFDFSQVFAAEVDGPYIITDVTLHYLPENAAPKPLACIDCHQTAAFRWQDFGDTPFRITDDVRDWLETVSADGRESSTLLHIRFNVEVPTTLENNFSFTAALRTSTGQSIRSVETWPAFQGPEDLISGLWPIEMVFDTGDLIDAEVPGPYTLFNICAKRHAPEEIIPLEAEIETSAYQLEQFAYAMTTYPIHEYPGMAIASTPVPDKPGRYDATLTLTRQDAHPQDNSHLRSGEPLAGPFALAIAEDDFDVDCQLVGAQLVTLRSGQYQYLDCEEKVVEQLRSQGNHDDCLDDGESITLHFQYTCAGLNAPSPLPVQLLGRLTAPLGYHHHHRTIVKCLSTDLNQDFRISDEEAAAARRQWEDGDISHHILLQTLEFQHTGGYRFNPQLNDFEPLE